MSLIARKPDAGEDAVDGVSPRRPAKAAAPSRWAARQDIDSEEGGGRRSEVRGIEGGGTRRSTQTVTHFRVSLQGFSPPPLPRPENR